MARRGETGVEPGSGRDGEARGGDEERAPGSDARGRDRDGVADPDGRSVDDAGDDAGDDPGDDATRASGKGRPTPRRSQAEAAVRRPLVGGKKQRSTRAREERRLNAQRTQEAYLTEDQRYLPHRDRGPVRRYVRDLVDGRRNAGQYFLPAALVILMLTVLPYPITQLVSVVAMYTTLGVVLLDSLLVFRRTKSSVRERFGEKGLESGLGMYAVGRSLQLRRMRRPVPQVRHGEKPR